MLIINGLFNYEFIIAVVVISVKEHEYEHELCHIYLTHTHIYIYILCYEIKVEGRVESSVLGDDKVP